MKIALFGDSFGVQKVDEQFNSWVTMLSQHFEIYNYSECGISQYKILKSIQRTNLSTYDKVLITHTSPGRVYVNVNPLHLVTRYHKNCDIIYSDIEKNSDDFSKACQMYFKYIFDFDHAMDMHNLICKEIDFLLANKSTIHITHFDYDNLYMFKDLINFYPLWLKNKGEVNHYNQAGNSQIFQVLLDQLRK